MKEDMDSDRITINVGGVRHETLRSTLRTLPGTRLTRLEADSDQSEFFFDRHPGVFSYVLNYYRTGRLHCPGDVCGALLAEELEFWGVDESDLEACCWTEYHRHRSEELPEGDGGEGQDGGRGQSCKDRIWALFEKPHSSTGAMAVAIVSMLFIVFSVIQLCVVSLPSMSGFGYSDDSGDIYGNFTIEQENYIISLGIALFITEVLYAAWFTFEFLVRFFTCPSKIAFIKNFMNVVDFVAILPFYIELLFPVNFLRVLRVARIIRLLRVFRMLPRSVGVKVIGQTMSASLSELSLLVVYLGIGVLIFAASVYYAEYDGMDSMFVSIPSALWWAVVSMTTLGYGDMVPVTVFGKMVGTLCAMSAVLTIALPVPVIMNNYSKFYKLETTKLKRPKKIRRYNIDAEVKDAQSGV